MFLFTSCSVPETKSFNDNALPYDWTVNTVEITGYFNPYTLIDEPAFSQVSEIHSLDTNSVVFMLAINNTIKVYPLEFIYKDEIVNDSSYEDVFAITYCPKTKSAICLNRKVQGTVLRLQASGYLYNDNLIAFDEKTDTYWSQMQSTCIKGTYAEHRLETLQLIQTTWSTVENYFPDALVYSAREEKAMSSYTTTKAFGPDNLFYGIIDNKIVQSNDDVYLFSFSDFDHETKSVQIYMGNQDIQVVGNRDICFMTSYIVDDTFTAVTSDFPIILKDSRGNAWNIFGRAVDGPNTGEQLPSPMSFYALDWAWDALYNLNKYEK